MRAAEPTRSWPSRRVKNAFDLTGQRIVITGAAEGIGAERVMTVNVLGPIHAARAFLPTMIKRRHGRTALVGSLAGRMGGLIAGPHYVASKDAIHALVKWLAKQAAPHNVVVNGIAPASVDTPMMKNRPVDVDRIPLGRQARPEEIAWPIAFLCSEPSSYVCGAVLDVNDGVYM